MHLLAIFLSILLFSLLFSSLFLSFPFSSPVSLLVFLFFQSLSLSISPHPTPSDVTVHRRFPETKALTLDRKPKDSGEEGSGSESGKKRWGKSNLKSKLFGGSEYCPSVAITSLLSLVVCA